MSLQLNIICNEFMRSHSSWPHSHFKMIFRMFSHLDTKVHIIIHFVLVKTFLMWYTSFHKIGYISDFGRFWSGYQIVLLYPPVSLFFQHSPPMRIFFIALLLSVTFRDFCLQGGFIIAKHLSFDSCSGIRSRVHVPPVRYLQRKIYFSRQSRFSA